MDSLMPRADTADAFLFGRIVGLACRERRPLTEALGLCPDDLAALLLRHLPGALALLDNLPPDAGRGEDALEEPDLRDYLREHGVRGSPEEGWLAAIVARRSLEPNHLWQDMGFHSRGELNAMFRRHFPALVALNVGDMKWKKFFYRQLCQREGLLLCKSPNCATCCDHAACFGGEEGAALAPVVAGGDMAASSGARPGPGL